MRHSEPNASCELCSPILRTSGTVLEIQSAHMIDIVQCSMLRLGIASHRYAGGHKKSDGNAAETRPSSN